MNERNELLSCVHQSNHSLDLLFDQTNILHELLTSMASNQSFPQKDPRVSIHCICVNPLFVLVYNKT